MPRILPQRERVVCSVCTCQRWGDLVSIYKESEIHTCAYSANLKVVTQETIFYPNPDHQKDYHFLREQHK